MGVKSLESPRDPHPSLPPERGKGKSASRLGAQVIPRPCRGGGLLAGQLEADFRRQPPFEPGIHPDFPFLFRHREPRLGLGGNAGEAQPRLASPKRTSMVTCIG